MKPDDIWLIIIIGFIMMFMVSVKIEYYKGDKILCPRKY